MSHDVAHLRVGGRIVGAVIRADLATLDAGAGPYRDSRAGCARGAAPRRTIRLLVVAAVVVLAALLRAATATASTFDFGEDRCTHCTTVSVDREGNVYASDRFASGIDVYAPNGDLIRTIESIGPYSAQVNDIAELPDGNLVVASNSGLHVMTPDGSWIADWTTDKPALGVVLDNAGNVFWTDGSVNKRDAVTGALSHVYSDPYLETGLGALAYDRVNDQIYLTDSGKGVRRISTSGESLGTYSPGNLDMAGIAVDDRGNVYLTSANAASYPIPRIFKFDPAGNMVGNYTGAGFPHQIQWNDGHLVVARENGISTIDIDTPAVGLTGPSTIRTAQRTTFQAGGSLPFGWITRFEWDLDGDGTFETDTGPSDTAGARYAVAGDRVVRVRVTGSNGGTSTTQMQVAVSPSRAALSAPSRVLTGRRVTLDATASAQPDSEIISARFDRDGDGTFETPARPDLRADVSYANAGTFNAAVRVVREGGVVDVAQRSISVALAPPRGRVGLSIEHGHRYTNHRRVHLDLVWPAFTRTVMVSTDRAFHGARRIPVGSRPTVTLPSSGSDQRPRTVYARFDDGTRTYADHIVLDRTRPRVLLAAIESTLDTGGSRGRSRTFVIALHATDRTSGVASVQVAATKKRPSRHLKYRERLTTRAASRPRYIRVQDGAGNYSAWKRLPARG